MSEHLLDYFAQVTFLEHFHHPTIEYFSNLIDVNDAPILASTMESGTGQMGPYALWGCNVFCGNRNLNWGRQKALWGMNVALVMAVKYFWL